MKIRNENKLRDMLTWLLSYPYQFLVKWLSDIEDEDQYPLIARDAAELFVSEAAPFVYLFLSLAIAKMLLVPTIEGLGWSIPSMSVDLFAHNILPALADAGTMFSSAELMEDKRVELVDKRKDLSARSVEYQRCGDAIRDLRGCVWVVRLIAAAMAAILAFGLTDVLLGPLVVYMAPVLSALVMVFASFLAADSQAWVDDGVKVYEGLSETEKQALESDNLGKKALKR